MTRDDSMRGTLSPNDKIRHLSTGDVGHVMLTSTCGWIVSVIWKDASHTAAIDVSFLAHA